MAFYCPILHSGMGRPLFSQRGVRRKLQHWVARTLILTSCTRTSHGPAHLTDPLSIFLGHLLKYPPLSLVRCFRSGPTRGQPSMVWFQSTLIDSLLHHRWEWFSHACCPQQDIDNSKQTSTITQFRVIDYGMENCTLALTIPPHVHSGFVISDLEEDFSHVDVWALSSIDKLDLRHLSWNTKPACTTYLGTLAAAYGSMHYLPSFLCPTGSYQTFELSCLKANCHIDVTSLERRAFGMHDFHRFISFHVLMPCSGLYMLQHQTI